MKKVLPSLACFLAILFSFIFLWLYPARTGEKTVQAEKVVLRLWHVDTFEGGKGSRAAFLNRVARTFESGREGVYIMVETFTKEGVESSLEEGQSPDMISFSCGVEGVAELAKALPFSFVGGRLDDGCYAYPWAAGRYYLFSLTDDFTGINEETLVLSEGGKNIPQAAAALAGLQGEFKRENSTSAYVDFLSGKYRYMLGTQRDVCRFAARGVDVKKKTVEEYSDLFQYISVVSDQAREGEVSQKFVNYLLSAEVGEKLSEIGMYPAETVKVESTLCAFTDGAGVENLRNVAEQALVSGDTKILKSYLKPLN